MLNKVKNWWKGIHLSLKMKLTLSLSAIAVVLLISSIISILEYRRTSNYVSERISDNINSIHVAQSLAGVVDAYNLQILTVIGDDSVNSLPDFDQRRFVFYCDSLKNAFSGKTLLPLTDSVLYAYSAYMLTSLELEEVIQSDFTDTRAWYFERLQPVFHRLRAYISRLSEAMYGELRENAREFDHGFYRSIVPGFVAVSVGIILILLLMFFMISYYVDPLYRMLDALENYLHYGRKYNQPFDGDDQLSQLNEHITELTEENRQLRLRNKDLKERLRDES